MLLIRGMWKKVNNATGKLHSSRDQKVNLGSL